MRRRLFLLTLFAVGCTTDQDQAIDPVWGKQPCSHCQMLVSQRQSAAQLVHNGERYYFDDIGCMVQWLDERHVEARAWVRWGDGWLDAERARYQGGATTPMDHGYLANGSGDVTFAELRKRVLARSKGASP